MEPNKEVIREWVTALRSGEYAQTKGTLRSGGTKGSEAGFCCLGVLCQLGADKGVIPQPEKTTSFVDNYDYDGQTAMPPTRIIEWVGIMEFVVAANDSDAGLKCKDEKTGRMITGLADLNDRGGASFNDIADRVEREFL